VLHSQLTFSKKKTLVFRIAKKKQASRSNKHQHARIGMLASLTLPTKKTNNSLSKTTRLRFPHHRETSKIRCVMDAFWLNAGHQLAE